MNNALARYRLFQVSSQILENLLLALLDFEQDRLRHFDCGPAANGPYAPPGLSQIAYALLREKHLVISLNHGSSGSTTPRIRKLPDV